MYAAITISLCYDSRGRAQSRGRRKVIVKCFTAAVICGIITELGQEYLTDYRSGDIFDFIVNTAGAATGCLISAIILYYYTKKIDV
ncbi:MAG: VanZ family protein [Bacteroidales bacterium]